IELSGYFTDDPAEIALVNYWANLSGSGNEILNGIFSYSTKDAFVDYASWSAVQVSAVPLPAAAWVFGAALVGLAGMSRRKKTAL
ncbi:MAG: VPLPA-CTERM sorting domain-containing protein, partial [Sneathiellales bacterium]|nr:VPLPA-CTERM sorting domain-containing protein [Sneathiellales bacterium]